MVCVALQIDLFLSRVNSSFQTQQTKIFRFEVFVFIGSRQVTKFPGSAESALIDFTFHYRYWVSILSNQRRWRSFASPPLISTLILSNEIFPAGPASKLSIRYWVGGSVVWYEENSWITGLCDLNENTLIRPFSLRFTDKKCYSRWPYFQRMSLVNYDALIKTFNFDLVTLLSLIFCAQSSNWWNLTFLSNLLKFRETSSRNNWPCALHCTCGCKVSL